jgi:hypothetical protein
VEASRFWKFANKPNAIPYHPEDCYDCDTNNSHLHGNEVVESLQADYLASVELSSAAQRESQRLPDKNDEPIPVHRAAPEVWSGFNA